MAGSPWGRIQHANKIMRGVRQVHTPGHGGIMMTPKAHAVLTPAGQAEAEPYGTTRAGGVAYYCYEEDCASAVPLWEIFFHDKTPAESEAAAKLYMAQRSRYTLEQLREDLWRSLSRWNPRYLEAIGVTPHQDSYQDFLEKEENDRRRASRDPGFIMSAKSLSDSVVQVCTADGQTHYVTKDSYQRVRDAGRSELNECTIIKATEVAA